MTKKNENNIVYHLDSGDRHFAFHNLMMMISNDFGSTQCIYSIMNPHFSSAENRAP